MRHGVRPDARIVGALQASWPANRPASREGRNVVREALERERQEALTLRDQRYRANVRLIGWLLVVVLGSSAGRVLSCT